MSDKQTIREAQARAIARKSEHEKASVHSELGAALHEMVNLRTQLAAALAENARLLECIAQARLSLTNILPSA